MGTIGRSIVWFAIGVVLATAGWLAVQAWHGRAAPAAPVSFLRSYNVRPELAGEIRNALAPAIGPYTVGLAPNGQLLVAAPPSYQSGVEQFLKEVAARKPSATPSIRLDAWFVTASPGASSDSQTLKEVEPALRALEQSKGPARFELLEQLSTQALSGGGSSEVLGARARMEVSVSVLRDSQDRPVVSAQLRLHANQGPGGTITAQAELRPGELLVLGQSSITDKGGNDRQLYYIVRATL
jgi:hypothetical protein